MDYVVTLHKELDEVATTDGSSKVQEQIQGFTEGSFQRAANVLPHPQNNTLSPTHVDA